MHDLKVINRQPAEGPVKFSGTYDVQEVFPTIQGEGPDAGVPAVFVRLAGCTLTCPACDSDYTSKRTSKTVVDLLKEVVDARAQSKADLLVITAPVADTARTMPCRLPYSGVSSLARVTRKIV